LIKPTHHGQDPRKNLHETHLNTNNKLINKAKADDTFTT
jgi:hypothetical protein